MLNFRITRVEAKNISEVRALDGSYLRKATAEEEAMYAALRKSEEELEAAAGTISVCQFKELSLRTLVESLRRLADLHQAAKVLVAKTTPGRRTIEESELAAAVAAAADVPAAIMRDAGVGHAGLRGDLLG